MREKDGRGRQNMADRAGESTRKAKPKRRYKIGAKLIISL